MCVCGVETVIESSEFNYRLLFFLKGCSEVLYGTVRCGKDCSLEETR